MDHSSTFMKNWKLKISRDQLRHVYYDVRNNEKVRASKIENNIEFKNIMEPICQSFPVSMLRGFIDLTYGLQHSVLWRF